MGWIFFGIAAAFGAAVGGAISYRNNERARQAQAKQEAIDFINSSSNILNSNLTSIQEQLNYISGLELGIKDNEHNISVNNEWLKMYQGMLDGEDNLLTQYRDELQNNIADANNTLDLAHKMLLQRQTEAAAYLQSSQLEKENAAKQGYANYAELMSKKSLANVMAGATGAVVGAYQASALKQRDAIEKYVGSDLRFNIDGSFDDAGSGSFAREFVALTTAINANIEANNLNIQAAQYDITKSEHALDSSKHALDQQLYEWEQNREELEYQNTDMAEANKINRENIERTYEVTIKTLQQNAVDALKDYQKYAGTAGKSQEEIDAFVERYRKAYGDIGIPLDNSEYKKTNEEIAKEWLDKNALSVRADTKMLQKKARYGLASQEEIDEFNKKYEIHWNNS